MATLGDGTSLPALAPVQVSGLSDATQLALGPEHSCAVRSDGHLACWGSYTWGNFGDGKINAILAATAGLQLAFSLLLTLAFSL